MASLTLVQVEGSMLGEIAFASLELKEVMAAAPAPMLAFLMKFLLDRLLRPLSGSSFMTAISVSPKLVDIMIPFLVDNLCPPTLYAQ